MQKCILEQRHRRRRRRRRRRRSGLHESESSTAHRRLRRLHRRRRRRRRIQKLKVKEKSENGAPHHRTIFTVRPPPPFAFRIWPPLPTYTFPGPCACTGGGLHWFR